MKLTFGDLRETALPRVIVDWENGNPLFSEDYPGHVQMPPGESLPVEEPAIDASPNDVHEPAANNPAVVTYPAAAGLRHVISGVAWSYSGDDPTGGNLLILDGAARVFSMNITTEGAGFIPFPRDKRGAVGALMRITLAAGGATVTGTLSILNHWTE